jgi:hypothetical protein
MKESENKVVFPAPVKNSTPERLEAYNRTLILVIFASDGSKL